MNIEDVGSLIQGSAEWHAHRARHNNASEAGAVMGVNPWAPRNPVELYDLKTGTLEVKFNQAMQHGVDTESEARQYVENLLKDDFTPCVRVNGRYSASMDGLSFFGETGLEIKCPMNTESKLFNIATPQQIIDQAPHYWYQLVHQFWVLQDMRRIVFCIYHKDKQNVIIVDRELVEPFFDRLTQAWEAFNERLDKRERPIDEAVDDSQDFEMLVAAYKHEKLKLEAQEAALKVAEEAVKAYAKKSGKTALKGFGATVTMVTRQGSVDYTKIPALKGVDLEAYRKKPTSYWMIKL